MKKAIIVALMFAGFATVSCDKDDDNDSDPVTALDLVTSATWKIDTIGFDSDKDGNIDSPIPGGFQACELDNVITFYRDSTGIFDEGATRCDSADPQTIDFQWMFKNNDSVINFQGNLPGELKGDVNILTLTNTNFVMSKRVNITFPVPFDQNIIIALQK